MPRYISAIPQYFDDGGEPLIGGKLFFYESGTSTPIDLFYDVNLTIQAPNPAILSGSGRVPNIFFNGIAKVVLKDSADVQIWEADPVGDSGSTSSFENWSNLIVYGINDVVQGTDFELYASIISGNINNDPVTTPSAWEGVEFISTWNEFVTYQTSDIAKASNGFIYRSLQDNNIGNDPLTSPTYWGGTQAQDIPDASIELTKMVHMTAPNMIGRNTAGTGPQEEITPAQVRDNINVEDGADVTDTDNVTAAGAVMDSELASETGIKTLVVPDNTTITTYGADLVDSVDASEARTTLDVDIAGTDNSIPVTVIDTTDIDLTLGGTGQALSADLTPQVAFTPGTFNNATVTVNDKGIVTDITAGASGIQMQVTAEFTLTYNGFNTVSWPADWADVHYNVQLMARCLTAEDGYSVGETVQIFGASINANGGVTIKKRTNNAVVNSSTVGPRIIPDGGGATGAFVAGNWAWYLVGIGTLA